MPRTLLIVDDNDVNRRILCKMLGGEYDVLQAANGREAMAALQRSHEIISAVLLDIVMPEMDGYEVLEAMSGDERLRSIPVIVTTGNTETGSEIKALTLGANDFVSKPYNVEIIRRRLRNTIRLRETAAMVNALRIDRLTGLLTRGAFLDKAAELIAARQPGYYMMAAFDIDNFKVINDQYGTAKGDDVLRAVARLLSGVFETVGGLCCRVTADSFAVLYPRSFSGTARSQELQAALGALDGSLQPITFRIGVYAVDDLSLPASAMFDRASMAEASIKGRYDTRVAFYDEAMRASILREQKIVNEMNSALSEGRFELWLQPQYNHATGALIGSEALVRWRQADGGLVPPGDFIPVFERNGFIYEMDKYVWEQACALLRRWLDGSVPVLPISINISRHDVFRADFYETLTGLVAKYGIPVDLLRLEITESAFVKSSAQIVAMVERLMAFGFTIEIDDFGSGYSSLNTLKDVPATVLKLDMKFLEGSDHSQRGGNILESIVRMAKWLGMSVIAEGVETREQADFLKSIGCCYVQGYYYARPMPVSDYEALAVSRRGEARMSALETVETLDNDAFWDPHSMDTLIFNSYVGGACIVEYTNRRMEILRANDKFLREFAPDGSTLSSLHLRSRLNEQDFIALYACFDRAVSTGEEAACEVTVAPQAGGDAQFIRAAVRLIARAGERLLLYCGVTNVTALRAAERRGRDSEDRLSAIIEGINGGVTAMVMLGEQPSFLFANQRYFEQLGYTRAQYHAEVASVFDLVHPDDRERIEGEVRQASRLRRPFAATYRVTRRDGGVRWMQSSVSLVDFEGVPAPVQLSVQNDVTAERQAYAELEARDEQLRLLSDAAHDLLAQVDESRGIERVLQTLLTYFGGDRAYLFELDEEGRRCANTYEVCAPGVTPEQGRLQAVPFSPFWQRAFERRRCVSIRDVDRLEGERAEEKELLAAQGIHSLIAVPLRRDDRLTGFIGVDNPAKRQDRAERLEAIGDYLSSTLWRRDLVRRIESDKETFRLMDEQRHQLLEKL
ncbi:MAG: EAL domain-containing protein, partial [Eubacteriales bacterium]|nr:EAL domain-containing protein [Eubacteriales bacterium]